MLVAIDCGFLAAPAYGEVKFVPNTKLGAYAKFSCNKGFKLVGDESRRCQKNGDWSGSQPICKSKAHPSSGMNRFFDFSSKQELNIIHMNTVMIINLAMTDLYH